MDPRQASAFLFVLSLGLFAEAHWKTCPNAESIIKDTLNKFDRSFAGRVLRLHFHDCFVNGCDGSILLESNPDGSDVERNAPANQDSAKGFEVIEEAKRKLEESCPGVVSCADTLAIAARDSVVKMGGQYYEVSTGRYDGKVSSIELARANLPAPNFSIEQLIDNFRRQGLSAEDLVVLSGAHTLGVSQCRFFSQGQFDRLYNFNGTGKPDPTISSSYLLHLRSICPSGSSNVVELDRNSQFSFDNSYYRNLQNRNGILGSDQVLAESQVTAATVQTLASDSDKFASKFAQSMIRMGNIGWKTQSNGEIRKVCSKVNEDEDDDED